MAYLWDSNILRHYTAKHQALLGYLERIPSREILIPVIVYAEQLRGRIEGLLKAEPARMLIAQRHLKSTQELLDGFETLYLDEAAITIATQLRQRTKTRKRYADLIITAQAIAGHHILVTRNMSDFEDILPSP